VLETLGLSESDANVYGVWLRQPSWNTRKVASELDKSLEDVAASRERLLATGLFTADPARPARVLPVGPDALVERFIADIDADAARQRADVLKARAELSALVGDYLAEHKEEPPPDIELIKQAPTAGLYLDERMRAAEREILALHTGGVAPDHDAAGMLPAPDLYLHQLRRGVSVRVIYEHEQVANGPTLEYLGRLVDEGAQIRTTARQRTWSVVIDRSVGVVPTGTGSDEGIHIVRGSGIVAALSMLFEHCWSLAQPLSSITANPSPLGERDRLLLRLLSLGLKDESVARNMGVSVRTVRRRISVLCDRLGVTSRFQAGVQATNRGWL
jgi:DNA-binding CsgD family transcriptional regulator/sugar-specific transcriptional regulator TrmB